MHTFRTGYGLVVTCLAVVCVLGYSCLFYIFYRKPKLMSSNILLMSLAVSDAFIILRCIRTIFSCMQIWVMTDSTCQDDAFIGMAFTLISISTAAAISHDKYQAACTSNKKPSSLLQIIKIWIAGLFAAALPLYGVNSYNFETDDPELRVSCLLDFRKRSVAGTIYVLAIFAMFLARPLCDVFFNYKRCSELVSVAKSQNVSFQAHTLIPLQMIASLSPYALFAGLSSFGLIQLPSWYMYSVFNNIMAKTFIATNPFVYMLTDPELNAAFKEITGMRPEIGSDDASRKGARSD